MISCFLSRANILKMFPRIWTAIFCVSLALGLAQAKNGKRTFHFAQEPQQEEGEKGNNSLTPRDSSTGGFPKKPFLFYKKNLSFFHR